MTRLAILGIIFLGGFAYSYLFWEHPYMGGYPDVAIFAQSALQTIQNGVITSQAPEGGILAAQLFPFVFLNSAIFSLINGLEPLVNLWIFQQIIPFLYVAIFYIIGRDLTKSVWGGILTAFTTGIIADLPLLIDQTFSRFISTYLFSFIFFIATIAFLPKLFSYKAQYRASLLLFILGSGVFFSHHHFGAFRLFILFLWIACLTYLPPFKERLFEKKRGRFLLLATIFLFLFFIITNAPLLPKFISSWVLPSIMGKNTEIIEESSIETSSGSFLEDMPYSSILFSNYIFTFVIFLGIAGILFASFHFFKKKNFKPFIPQIIITSIVLINAIINILAISLGSPFPPRHLREISALIMPFAAFLLWYGLKRLPKLIIIILLIIFFGGSSFIWFSKIFNFEKLFNTGWQNITFSRWAQQNIHSKAKILTDPFSYHVLRASIPYIQDPAESLDRTTAAEAEKNVMSLDSSRLESSLRLLCPEFIVIDPPQTSQFFALAPAEQWFNYPQFFRVIFDSEESAKKRILALKVTTNLCSKNN